MQGQDSEDDGNRDHGFLLKEYNERWKELVSSKFELERLLADCVSMVRKASLNLNISFDSIASKAESTATETIAQYVDEIAFEYMQVAASAGNTTFEDANRTEHFRKLGIHLRRIDQQKLIATLTASKREIHQAESTLPTSSSLHLPPDLSGIPSDAGQLSFRPENSETAQDIMRRLFLVGGTKNENGNPMLVEKVRGLIDVLSDAVELIHDIRNLQDRLESGAHIARETEHVRLFGPNEPVNLKIAGKWIEKGTLNPRQYSIVCSLIDAHPKGLTKDELDHKAGGTNLPSYLRKWRKSDEDWKSVIMMSGQERLGYRII
jgi:hypothetical protein